MKLTVTRNLVMPLSTAGMLDVDGIFQCYTLEPARPIPAGVYDIRLLFSPKFNCITPHVMDVPGFTAIEIHCGNYPTDTEGCLLVGETHPEPDFIGNSREAFMALMQKLLNTTQQLSIEYLESAAMLVTDPEIGL